MKKLILTMAFMLLMFGCSPQPENETQKMIRLVDESCDVFEFPSAWALAIMWSEHSGIKNVNQKCSYKRTAYGPGGILYRTAKDDLGYKGKEQDLNNCEVSIPLCVAYMAKLYKAYNGNMVFVVNHYQSGNKYNDKYYNKVEKIIFGACL